MRRDVAVGGAKDTQKLRVATGDRVFRFSDFIPAGVRVCLWSPATMLPGVSLPMSYPAFLDSTDPAIYALRTAAPGPTGKLPLTAQLLRNATSGHVFGMTQNAGMGWDPRKLLGKEFLILRARRAASVRPTGRR